MHKYKGITWDHPRGYNALAAAAASVDPVRKGFSIEWHKQPLEDFESHPIADLCNHYDLVVLDHPHVGEAVEGECLRPLEEVFGADFIADLGMAVIGPCVDSYRYADRHWALPLDAAAQVMAARPDLLGTMPETWDDVIALSKMTEKVGMSLAGPHALLSFFSIATALGEPPGTKYPDMLISTEVGMRVFDLMADLTSRCPEYFLEKNPIGILDYMTEHDGIFLCPLVYGYVNYAAPCRSKPVRFADAPCVQRGGRPGSTLGGTGVGISARCEMTPELHEHLLWLMDEYSQKEFIPAHDGQPSLRVAWFDSKVNACSGNFYRNTSETLEAAYVRPRYPGYIAFQNEASMLLRNAFAKGTPARTVLKEMQTLYQTSRRKRGEL